MNSILMKHPTLGNEHVPESEQATREAAGWVKFPRSKADKAAGPYDADGSKAIADEAKRREEAQLEENRRIASERREETQRAEDKRLAAERKEQDRVRKAQNE